MAIVLPFVRAFLFGLTEFGRAIWTKATLDFAVESAARCYAVNTTNCGTAGRHRPMRPAGPPGWALGTAFTVTLPSCGNR